MSLGDDEISTATRDEKLPHLWMVLVIIGVVVASFWPIFSTPYSPVDDYTMIPTNPRYLNPSFANLFKHFSDPEWNIFAPVTYVIWHVISMVALDPAVSGVDRIPAYPFKIVSVLTHVLSAMACYRLLSQLIVSRVAVLVGALVFALHPVQVESVAWTTGLKDELCGLFSLLSISFYLQYLNEKKVVWWRATFICVFLAVLSKPTANILPLTLFCIDCVWVDRKLEKRIADTIYFIIPAVLSVVVMIRIQSPNDLYSPVWSRPLVAMDTICFYLYKSIFPIYLVPDYGRAPSDLFQEGFIYWTWIIPVLIFILLRRYKNRLLSLAAILFVLPVIPISGIKNFDMQQYTTVTDHYMYQSMAGIGLLAAFLVMCFERSRYVALVIIAVLGVLTFQQSSRWQEPMRMMERNASLYPKAVLPRTTLASDYINSNQFAKAEPLLQEAVQVRGRSRDLGMLTLSLYQLGRVDEANKISEQALDRGWNDRTILNRSAHAAADKGQFDAALNIARRWAIVDPKSGLAQRFLDETAIARKRSAASQPTTQPAD